MEIFWFFKNEKLVKALTKLEEKFPILQAYFHTVSEGIAEASYANILIHGDIVVITGENAGYVLDDYFFNERESEKFSEFLGEGWYIGRTKTNFFPIGEEWSLLFK